MNQNLKNELFKSIVFIPGLVGLSSIDFSKKPIVLFEKNLEEGFSFIKTPLGFDVVVGAIIFSNIIAKNVVIGIITVVQNFFQKNNIKLNNIKVYIRGVQ